jgi:hypothetical protein
MSSQNPETPDLPPRRLRPDDFLTYDELLMVLPPKTTKDAIRKLVKERGLPVHRIGMHRMFLGSEVIAASTVGGDDWETDTED